MDLRLDDAMADVHPDALSIAQLYGEVAGVLSRTFPKSRALWVRGEVQSYSDRTGHCYIDLVDPEARGQRQAPVLKVRCWQTTWGPIKRTLRRSGIQLEVGMVVLLRGSIEFYAPRAEVSFILAELDVTALLGRMAAQRAALLATLSGEGLLRANGARPVPEVPLSVGLVASPGTEGFSDFVGQLEASGFAFRVTVARAAVQGKGAPLSVARALRALGAHGCDLVVLVRGGGSKADLAAFDAEPVARAIALSPVPVWTGIGHTGDESVADIVANQSFVTPTDCGRELAQRVGRWWEDRVGRPAALVGRRTVEALADAGRRDAQARGRLTSAARHQLRWHTERLAGRAAGLALRGPLVVTEAQESVLGRSAALGPLARGHVARADDRITSWRRLLDAYDVGRQLDRGYTLTLDAEGRVLRSIEDFGPGARLRTRFADGDAQSVVESVAAGPPGERG